MERSPEAAWFLRGPGGRLRLGWRLLFFALLTFAVGALATLVLPLGQVAGSAALLVGALAAGVFVLGLEGRPPRALGFHVSAAAAVEGGLGLALGVGVGGVVLVAIAVAGGIEWAREPGTASTWLAGSIGALAFLVLPAAAEEALLRGYPMQALAEALGVWPALGLTAAAFGALHLGNPGVTVIATVNVAVAGVFLGIIYLKTLSLWWATGAHLGWNWAQGYLADVPVSGLELMDAPFYDGLARGPEWLGGGSFGPEGSLVATAVVVAASVACWRARWLRPSAAALSARPLVTPLEVSA